MTEHQRKLAQQGQTALELLIERYLRDAGLIMGCYYFWQKGIT